MEKRIIKPTTNYRWRIGVMLGIGIIISYLDRVNISVAGSHMAEEFGWSDTQLGLLFSAFFWSYTLMMVPVGVILDKIGIKWIMRVGTLLWSIATLSTALIGGFGGVLVMRMILGATEAPGYPSSAKATGYWFPLHERGLATSIFDGAAKLASAIGIGVCTWAIMQWGWQGAFVVTGLLNLAYTFIFWIMYRDPSEHPKLSSEEYEYIKQHGGQLTGHAEGTIITNFLALMRSRKVWGITIGIMANGFTYFLMLTWLPIYMTKQLNLDLVKGGMYTAIPWIVAFFSELLIAGWLLDKLITKGYSPNKVRKAFLVIGMLFGSIVLLQPTTNDPILAVTYLSIALGGLAFSSGVCWSIPSIIAPKGMVGSVSSFMNLFNNLMGVSAPFITGYIVDVTGTFKSAFVLSGAILIVGSLSYLFVMGDIEQINLKKNGNNPTTLKEGKNI
ncbi:MFS transporter [Priestia filamentosa]|uniref:MFS transporter n=1 Tax=Priestia filamentosa TaxID=1402861 RepID=UPI000E7605A9|nr:MFS transporter [Priestia filamentosa]RJS63140.1 MFS transporter [Priestia filamentosa]